ncbi:hypothetical protein MGYG_05245 [Nannizzia gypsea CBS 118893]|uniref:Uncharacterized protein n=1 Tax=Arthroderma gypseum (strain ATCC MYA-4604 / CBS 118893) TaxID=535722 RepID=E4UVB5_ARTGP|nr:hypothetical protein MGYG_05245 [Nannizzia gypsea CBS 118893]EFR02242.1 hypothetical protein MGYG_05245 [Nannizzia gypsea CBS 118893]
MDDDTTTIKTYILRSERDWDLWYAYMYGFARSRRIWDLVNPEIEGEPAFLTKPPRPTRPPPDADVILKEEYMMDLAEREVAMYKFDREQQALSEFRDRLVFSVQHYIMNRLAREEHCHVIFKALKERLCPTELDRRREVRKRWKALTNGP